MSLESLLKNKALAQSIEEGLGRIRADIQGVLEASDQQDPGEDDGDEDEEDWGFAFEQAIQEDAECLADDLMPFFQRGSRPWPVIHRQDLCDFFSAVFRRIGYSRESLTRLPTALDILDRRSETTLRHAIWHLAERVKLGASPLGFIASMAVFERCSSVLFCYDKREHGPLHLAEFLRDKVGLGPRGHDSLSDLVRSSNNVVHDLACGVAVSKTLLAWRLAWAATHYLLCRLSQTESLDCASPQSFSRWLKNELGEGGEREPQTLDSDD